jgi:hypothetical protein
VKRYVVALCVAGLTFPAIASTPARAAENECSTPTGSSCTFHCNVNNDIRVEVTGVGTGRAACSNLSVECTSPNGFELGCGRWGDGYITPTGGWGSCGFVGVGVGTVRCYAT